MRMLLKLIPLLGILLLGACSAPVTVAPVNITAADLGATKIPGTYAVYVQTGGWQVEVENQTFSCSAWSFDTSFDSALETAVQSAFENSFEAVTFTPGALKPEDLTAQGLDAQILIYQASIQASYSVAPQWFSAMVMSSATVDGIIAITDRTGLAHQASVQGSGSYQESISGRCDAAGAIVGKAGSEAIKDFAVELVRRAREKILELKLQAVSAS